MIRPRSQGTYPRPLTSETVELIRQVLDETSPNRDAPGFAPLSEKYQRDPAALARAPRRDLDGNKCLRLVT